MTGGPDTLRVSVVGGHDRVDLVVPAAVTVAELLPELLLRLGDGDLLPGPADARLAVLGGPPLEAGDALAAQGVGDGAVLTVTAAVDHVEPPAGVDDDLTTVVADTVATVPRPDDAVARWSASAVATALLGLGAAGVAVLATPAAAAVSGVVCVVLLLTVLAAGRPPESPVVATTAGWLAVAHAGAAGLTLGCVGAGSAWVVAGSAAALAGGRRGRPLWAAALAGAVLAAAGAAAALTTVPLAVVLTAAVVLVVVTGDLHPWLAASLAGLVPPPLGEDPPSAPDRDAVALAVRRAHELLLVGGLATGLLLTALGLVVAGRGHWGVALVLVCAAVVALRSRRQRIGTAGLVGRLGGTVPLLPAALAVWWQWPEWRLAALAIVTGAGLLGLAAVARPGPLRSARAGRLAELAEAVALVALPPLLLAATGLLDLVEELVG
ncbi:EsaB/YukD family protein [Nocardioides sp. GXQ0305]|uniref:EsaB/YukD family protein n=1 Tax=Nocardioides sp. GXQ0305 TaxID=3423912 RepID=UPI003D7F0A6D